jgi:hypothetical protein
MNKFFLSALFFTPACANNTLLFEQQVEQCVYGLLDKSPQVRYVEGKFVDITDFCEKVYKVNKQEQLTIPIKKGN